LIVLLLIAAAAGGAWWFLLGPGAGGQEPGNSSGDEPLTAPLPPAPGATPAPTPEAPAAEPAEQFDQSAVIQDPNGYTNVYGGPSPVSPIVARVSAGESFTTYDQGGDWWRVRTAGGLIGYMPRSRISVQGAAPAAAPAATPTLATPAPGTEPVPGMTPPTAAPKAQRPPRPRSRINRANSANMRAFCQNAGRGTPQCRQFRRDAGGR
jgi:hypothetical protein